MKKAIVLGGGGFIGGHLAKYLKDSGYHVRICDIKNHDFFNHHQPGRMCDTLAFLFNHHRPGVECCGMSPSAQFGIFLIVIAMCDEDV